MTKSDFSSHPTSLDALVTCRKTGTVSFSLFESMRAPRGVRIVLHFEELDVVAPIHRNEESALYAA